jgi:sigma-E factor negative regulatory protein RseA
LTYGVAVTDEVGVINEELDSQLSAMLDGQLPGTECELLSRRLGRDEQLRARWARYAVIGAVMRSEPVSTVRTNFARRVSAAIVADSRSAPRRVAGGRRLAWRFGVGSALVASVAAVSVLVLVLRQHSAPLADEVVIAQMPSAAAPVTAVIATKPEALQFTTASREPASYVVPPAGSGGRLAPPAELANFVVAHSEYSSPLMRRNLLSALVSSDAAEVDKAATLDASSGFSSSAGAADASNGSPAP